MNQKRYWALLLTLILAFTALTACGGAQLNDEDDLAPEELNEETVLGVWAAEIPVKDLLEAETDGSVEFRILFHEDGTATFQISEEDFSDILNTAEKSDKERLETFRNIFGDPEQGYRSVSGWEYVLDENEVTILDSEEERFSGIYEEGTLKTIYPETLSGEFKKVSNDREKPKGAAQKPAPDRLTEKILEGTWGWNVDLSEFAEEELGFPLPITALFIFEGNNFTISLNQVSLLSDVDAALRAAINDDAFFKEMTGISRAEFDVLLQQAGVSMEDLLDPILAEALMAISTDMDELLGTPDENGNYVGIEGKYKLDGDELYIYATGEFDDDTKIDYIYDPDTGILTLNIEGQTIELKKQ